jgi:hypothetical protein
VDDYASTLTILSFSSPIVAFTIVHVGLADAVHAANAVAVGSGN